MEYLKSYNQSYLNYYNMLKACISYSEQWNEIVNKIIHNNPNDLFVCSILSEKSGMMNG